MLFTQCTSPSPSSILFRPRKLTVGSMCAIKFSIFLPFQSFTLCPIAGKNPAKAGPFTLPTHFFKNLTYFPIATANQFLGTGQVFHGFGTSEPLESTKGERRGIQIQRETLTSASDWQGQLFYSVCPFFLRGAVESLSRGMSAAPGLPGEQHGKTLASRAHATGTDF